MNNETRTVMPDFYTYRVDDTGYYLDSVKAKVNKIYSIFLIDKSKRTFCCSARPCYAVYFLDTVVEAKNESDYDDEKFMSFVEEIENNNAGGDDTPYYYNCSEVDKDTDNLKPYFPTPECAKEFYENEGWQTKKEYANIINELIGSYSEDPDW